MLWIIYHGFKTLMGLIDQIDIFVLKNNFLVDQSNNSVNKTTNKNKLQKNPDL